MSSSDEAFRLVNNETPLNKSIFSHVIIDDIVHAVETASENGIEPIMISQGSSGSYFVRDSSKNLIGVFKPRDEEPYEARNPKWGKYFHRLCCPCFFGRPCLINNHGYLSEAGASLIDEALDLNIVPTTRVVSLTSTAFNHKKINIMKSRTKTQIAEKFPDIGRKFHRLGVPPKLGSLQLYVSNYKSADSCLDHLFNSVLNKNEILKDEFIYEFQKLVILDYIIRNTDRNNSNWLIKYPEKCDKISGDIVNNEDDDSISIKIAAIDNGLAFPYKHPDQVRAYPYYWSWLDVAGIPFSDKICNTMLPMLSKTDFVESIVENLRILFKLNSNFKKSKFENQMSVMRGQIANLCKALQERKSPLELLNQTNMTLEVRSSQDPLLGPVHQDINDGTSCEGLISNAHNSTGAASDSTHSPDPPNRNKLIHYVAKYWKRPFFKAF